MSTPFYLVNADIEIQQQADGSFVAFGNTMPLLAVAATREGVTRLAEELVRETVAALVALGDGAVESFMAKHSVDYKIVAS